MYVCIIVCVKYFFWVKVCVPVIMYYLSIYKSGEKNKGKIMGLQGTKWPSMSSWVANAVAVVFLVQVLS